MKNNKPATVKEAKRQLEKEANKLHNAEIRLKKADYNLKQLKAKINSLKSFIGRANKEDEA